MSIPPRTQSPVTFGSAGQAMASGQGLTMATIPMLDAVDVDLVVRAIPRDPLLIETPFSVAFTLAVSATMVRARGRDRVLSIAVQHVQPTQIRPSQQPSAPAVESVDRRASVKPIGLASPSVTSTPLSRVMDDRTLVGSPRQQYLMHGEDERSGDGVPLLPSPVPEPEDAEKYAKPSAGGVRYLGASALFLPPVRLSPPGEEPQGSVESDDDSSASHDVKLPTAKVEASWDFELSYLPVRAGFSTVGGLRVLLVEDRWEDGDEKKALVEGRRPAPARVLKEWDVVGEIWVRG